MLSKFCGSLDYRWSRSRIKIPPNTPPSSFIPPYPEQAPPHANHSLPLLSCLLPTAPSQCAFRPFRPRLNSHFSPPPLVTSLPSPPLLCSSPILLKTNSLPSPTHMATPHSLFYSVLTTPFIFFSVPRGGYRGGAAGPSHPPEISRQKMFPIS